MSVAESSFSWPPSLLARARDLTGRLAAVEWLESRLRSRLVVLGLTPAGTDAWRCARTMERMGHRCHDDDDDDDDDRDHDRQHARAPTPHTAPTQTRSLRVGLETLRPRRRASESLRRMRRSFRSNSTTPNPDFPSSPRRCSAKPGSLLPTPSLGLQVGSESGPPALCSSHWQAC
eukprot:1709975-Rhodomonas_salina.1